MTTSDVLDIPPAIDAPSETPAADHPPVADVVALLEAAIASRDVEAARRVTALMDSNPALDAFLESRLFRILAEQPDAVYAFIRCRLGNQGNLRWLPRLKLAALYSLRVAITDADAATIINWLTLIAREPLTYDLGDVLHYGLLAALTRAYEEPELAWALVAIAAKRDPANLDTLLNDPALLAALPNNVGRVLRDMDGDLFHLIQQKGMELYLVAVARAAQARQTVMFTPEALVPLLELEEAGQPVGLLPPQLQPDFLLRILLTPSNGLLSNDTVNALASNLLRAGHDTLFLRLLHHPEAAHVMAPRLVHIFEQSERSLNEATELVGRAMGAGDLHPQEVVDLYAAMLDGLNWRRETLPLMQQFARSLKQFPVVHIAAGTLWNLLAAAADVKDELSARVSAKRLLEDLETREDESELTDHLLQLAAQTAWCETARTFITDWWRAYVRVQPVPRLHRLEKLLEGKRALETERDILHTLMAVRKMMGQWSLHEFAASVQSAFTVLEAMAESFDPNVRRSGHFDARMARDELDTQNDPLAPQERQVLANNLKELAYLIATMGDNRTRANLIRRGDDLDRELMAGEQEPHSAVDTMKWLAGHWGRTQDDDDDD